MLQKNESEDKFLDIPDFDDNYDPSMPQKDEENLLFKDSWEMKKELVKFFSFSNQGEAPVITEEAAWGKIAGEDSTTSQNYSMQAVVDEPQAVESQEESKITPEEELSTRSSDGGNGRGRPK